MYSIIIKSFLFFYLYNLVLCCNNSCKTNAGSKGELDNTGGEYKKIKKGFKPDSQLNTKENNSETLEKDKKADEVYEVIDRDYGIGSFMDEDEVKAKIKELGYYENKVREWVEETLLNNPS